MVSDNDVTEDLIYGGRVRLRQPARGYRVNIDTILLAASLPDGATGAGARVVELGCGVGGALLAMAKRAGEAGGEARFVGIERDPVYATLARENVIANGVSERVEIIESDVLNPPPELGVFDHVLANPPYDYAGEGRAPAPERSAAHVADRPIGDWIKVWSNRLEGQGDLTMIHRPQRLAEILAALDGRLGGVTIFPVRPNRESPASRVLVRPRKGSRAPLSLLGGLDLHPEAGAGEKYTPETEAILRGEALISLD
jgi:tRNA1(Val) A37 N6-methylase TrmN6